jgi:transposase
MGKSNTIVVTQASAQIVGQSTLYVGLDVHKDLLVSCVLPSAGKAIDESRLPNDPAKIREYLRRLAERFGAKLVIAYEAGVCGYSLCRLIRDMGHECNVAAPSLIPQAPGERKRKTDRRDAFKIARGLRAGDLSFVRVPDVQDEAARDLLRLRSDLKGHLADVRHRIQKFLLRKGIRYKGSSWTAKHAAWLEQQTFSEACERIVFDEYLGQYTFLQQRIAFVDAQLAEVAESPRYRVAVRHLQAFKGIAVLSALTLVLEIIDFRRFATARQLMSFLGMVPSEFSSGGPGKERRGHITKAGNPYCRHVLVEAAWQYRRSTSSRGVVEKRRTAVPGPVAAVALKADKRLHKRYLALSERRPAQVVAVAVARELVGFIWSIAVELEVNQ